MKQRFLLLIGISLIMTAAYSQANNIDSVKAELSAINHVFDSARFLAFDVDIQFNTDTVKGLFEAERELASYVLNGKDIYYAVSNIEYMQNDSFSITCYKEDKRIFVSKDGIKNQSSLFPVKSFSDSTLYYLLAVYNISVSDTDDVRQIRFITDSTNVPYKEFALTYNRLNYSLIAIDMTLLQAPEGDDDGIDEDSLSYPNPVPSPNFLIKKRINMTFQNYHFVDNADMFKDDTYIYYDRFRKDYVAVGKYKGYLVISSNMDNTSDVRDDIEVPANKQIN